MGVLVGGAVVTCGFVVFVVDVVVLDVVVDAVGTGTHSEEYIKLPVVLTNTGIPQVSTQPQISYIFKGEM